MSHSRWCRKEVGKSLPHNPCEGCGIHCLKGGGSKPRHMGKVIGGSLSVQSPCGQLQVEFIFITVSSGSGECGVLVPHLPAQYLNPEGTV